MRFINIENKDGNQVALNTATIGHIEFWGDVHNYVVVWCGGKAITTKFTSIDAAVDFIQRAPSVSMGVSQ